MVDKAQLMVDNYGLLYILEENNLTEADVIRMLLDRGLVTEPRHNPLRLDYEDDDG